MKKHIILFATISLFLSAFVTHGETAEFSKNYPEKISVIDLKCNAYLHIKIGSENKLTIKTDDSVINNINTTVENGTLNLMCKGQKKLWWDVVGIFSTNKKIDFYLTVKKLNGITITGIGKIFIEDNIKSDNFTISNLGTADIQMHSISAANFKINILGGGDLKIDSLSATNQMELNTSGSGHIYFNKINTPKLSLTITGNSTTNVKNLIAKELHVLILGNGAVTIHGNADTQNIKIDGSGRYNCGELISKNVNIKSFGSTSMEVFVQNTLSVDLYGSGIININGQPTIRKCSIYGKGNLILQSGAENVL
jgi:hypothetical protein